METLPSYHHFKRWDSIFKEAERDVLLRETIESREDKIYVERLAENLACHRMERECEKARHTYSKFPEDIIEKVIIPQILNGEEISLWVQRLLKN
ncbi:hypothetical protein COF37_21390 [Bacillus wiedmannii]|uniref:hypothetical protein n=1 Tax=Bacillus wiedmannii TaxID=1890302 RepID=UPI000BFE6A5F|nr:hypothetical protein [Bacillus wiedmannii]PHD21293.1 hypothetical protein COF37_21390 [Bacillus wiedmannii]